MEIRNISMFRFSKICLAAGIFAVGFFGFSSFVDAATYYISPSGDDGNSGTIVDPWLTPNISFGKLSAGDTLIFRAGSYQDASEMEPAVNGTAENRITLAAYPGEAVYWLGATTGGNAVVNITQASDFIAAALRLSGAYYTIDGIKVYGEIFVGAGGDNFIIQNSEFWECGDGSFGSCIRPEGAADGLITNNYIHDNDVLGFGDCATAGTNNCSMLIMYDSPNLIIEKNTFANSTAHAIYLKDNIDNITVRNNFFKDNTGAAAFGSNQDPGDSVYFHNNVVIGSDACFMHLWQIASVNIYNNTCYDNNIGIRAGWGDNGLTDFNWWNNIITSSTTYHVSVTNSAWPADVGFAGYNNYYGTGTLRAHTGAAYDPSTQSNSWQSYLGNKDLNIVTTDPGFINPSAGTPDGFKRSSYLTNGRGGSFGDVMGAYETGSEQIGVDWSEQSDTIPPSAPGGLSVV